MSARCRLSTRRQILAGTAGVSAAAVAGSAFAGDADELSEEYVTWERLAIERRAIIFSSYGVEVSNDEYESRFGARIEALWMAMGDSEAALAGKATHNLLDILALAVMAHHALNDSLREGPFSRPAVASDCGQGGELESARLVRAAVRIAHSTGRFRILDGADLTPREDGDA